MSISINSDMGESLGIHSFGNDDGLLELVDTVNIACGFHSGDPSGIHETVIKAAEAGVTIGAHPGLPDIAGFGRREMKLDADEVRDIVLYQVGALGGFLKAEGLELHHIKPHGSLYGMLARDETLMEAVCDVAEVYGVPVFGMAGTAHELVTSRRGVPFVSEVYVDLDYRSDGTLIIARRPQRTPLDKVEATTRRALESSTVLTESGELLPVIFASICVHSDTPNAIDVARVVRSVMSEY